METSSSFNIIENKSRVLHMCKQSVSLGGTTFFAFIDPTTKVWCLQSHGKVEYTSANYCPYCAGEFQGVESVIEGDYARATEQYLNINCVKVEDVGQHLESLVWIDRMVSTVQPMVKSNWCIWMLGYDGNRWSVW